jgi:hypothetical protein
MAALLEGRRPPLLPVLQKLVVVGDHWWPNLILNYLTGSPVSVGPGMYWAD